MDTLHDSLGHMFEFAATPESESLKPNQHLTAVT